MEEFNSRLAALNRALQLATAGAQPSPPATEADGRFQAMKNALILANGSQADAEPPAPKRSSGPYYGMPAPPVVNPLIRQFVDYQPSTDVAVGGKLLGEAGAIYQGLTGAKENPLDRGWGRRDAPMMDAIHNTAKGLISLPYDVYTAGKRVDDYVMGRNQPEKTSDTDDTAPRRP